MLQISCIKSSKVSEVRDKTSLTGGFFKKDATCLKQDWSFMSCKKFQKFQTTSLTSFFSRCKMLETTSFRVSEFHKFRKVSKVPNQILTSCFVEVQNASHFISLQSSKQNLWPVVFWRCKNAWNKSQSFWSFKRWIQILWPPRKNLIRPPIFHISKNNAQILNGGLNLVQLGTFFLKSLFAKIPSKLVENFNKIDNRTHWRRWIGYGK